VNIGGLDLKKAFNRKITTKSKFDIGLLDLGFSSYQLEDADRGFSYLNKVPTQGEESEEDNEGYLDMRYNSSLEADEASAADILNNSSEFELT
jgi:16S rRNA C1402 N4-methylase RsmH